MDAIDSASPKVVPAKLLIRNGPVLTTTRFSQSGDPIPPNQQVGLNLNLHVQRLDSAVLAVQLAVTIEGIPSLELQVIYGLVIELAEPEREEVALDGQLRFAAGIACPAILFPYVRQAVQDLTSKAGLLPFVLPIIDARSTFKPEELVIPTVTGINPYVDPGIKPPTKP